VKLALKRKDKLLTEYLPNYLQKVARNPGKPIVVVDGFAGPGRFGDGQEGSPVLIARTIEHAAPRMPKPASAFFIEKHDELHERLVKNTSPGFTEKVQSICDGFCEKLRSRFREVCTHDVKSDWRHKVPRYSLIFGSRVGVALMLMNDAMVESREMYAAATAPKGGQLSLIEDRPTSVVPDDGDLRQRLLDGATSWIKRSALVLGVARGKIGQWSESRMNQEVGVLLKAGRLKSETGKTRINEDIRVMRA
jgi:hypothetical protein